MTPENPEPLSEVSRLAGVFFEPTKTFEDIGRRPGWLVPLVVVILSALCVTMVISQRIGWARVLRQQMESSSRLQQLSPEQREQSLALQMKIAPVGAYAGVVLGVPLVNLVIAAVLLGITAMMSGGLRFKQVFAVVCYSGLPRVLMGILTMVVIFLKDPDRFNLRNPLAFNVGAFMDPNGGSKFCTRWRRRWTCLCCGPSC